MVYFPASQGIAPPGKQGDFQVSRYLASPQGRVALDLDNVYQVFAYSLDCSGPGRRSIEDQKTELREWTSPEVLPQKEHLIQDPSESRKTVRIPGRMTRVLGKVKGIESYIQFANRTRLVRAKLSQMTQVDQE